ncbi:hypothetical protein [Olivibacter jilunii]|uniref:hypothetical protein n=1 Tax=Olivibacter jilunii TaxID=985016 RepID=UPI001031A8EC|nr:hypothetical protein [Olivibacter jilunii]
MNRAEQIWRNWEEKQTRLNFSGLGDGAARAVLKSKYDHLRYGLYRLSLNPSPEERAFIGIGNSITRRMRRQLYPDRFIRLLISLTERLYDKPKHIRDFQREKEKSLEYLKWQFREKGLSALSGKLGHLLDTEEEKFTLPLTAQLNGKERIDLNVALIAEKPGKIAISHLEISLIDEHAQGRLKYTIDNESKISLHDAVKLLHGQAIKKTFENEDGQYVQRWLQADLNGKTENQDIKIMVFDPAFAYDLKAILTDFSRKSGIEGLSRDMVINELEKGGTVKFTAKDGQDYQMQADPREGSFLLRDSKNVPYSIENFLENNKAQNEYVNERQYVIHFPQTEQYRKQSMHI